MSSWGHVKTITISLTKAVTVCDKLLLTMLGILATQDGGLPCNSVELEPGDVYNSEKSKCLLQAYFELYD